MTGTLAASVKIDRLNMSERRECRVEIVRRRLQNRALKKTAEIGSLAWPSLLSELRVGDANRLRLHPATLKLTNLRAKGAAHPKKEGDAAASSSGGTGPIGAIKGLMRRGSGTADDIAAGVAAADLGGSPAGAAKGKFARRNSNASKTLQEAAGGS